MLKRFQFTFILCLSFLAMISCANNGPYDDEGLDPDLIGEWQEQTTNDRREVVTFDSEGRSAFFYLNVVTGEIEGQYQPMEWYTINNYLHQITQSSGVFVSEYDVTDSILTLDSGTPIAFTRQ